MKWRLGFGSWGWCSLICGCKQWSLGQCYFHWFEFGTVLSFWDPFCVDLFWKVLTEILKNSASEIKLPDLTNSILNNVNVVTKTTVKAKKRFKLRYLLAPCLAVASVIIIVISIFLNNRNISTNNEIDLTTSKLVIGKEVMLASSILNDEVNQPINLRYTQNDYENDINSIHEYLLTCDLLREDIVVDYKLYLNEDENYPYKYKMLLNYPNFTYTFYYNEVNTEYVIKIASTYFSIISINWEIHYKMEKYRT